MAQAYLGWWEPGDGTHYTVLVSNHNNSWNVGIAAGDSGVVGPYTGRCDMANIETVRDQNIVTVRAMESILAALLSMNPLSNEEKLVKSALAAAAQAHGIVYRGDKQEYNFEVYPCIPVTAAGQVCGYYSVPRDTLAILGKYKVAFFRIGYHGPNVIGTLVSPTPLLVEAISDVLNAVKDNRGW